MTFMLDNNLGQPLARGLRAFGEDVCHLIDHFPQDAKDQDWLPVIGERGWLLITRDERIRKNPAELAAFRTHKVGAFVLAGKSRSRCELIQQLVRHWPRIKQLAQNTRRPFAFRIPPSGTKIDPIPL